MTKRATSRDEAYAVTLVPGDGVGPEIDDGVVEIFAAAKASIHWERQIVSTESVEPGGQLVSDEALASMGKNRVALKGPLANPIGAGHVSLEAAFKGGVHLVAVPVDYSEKSRVLINELRNMPPASV